MEHGGPREYAVSAPSGLDPLHPQKASTLSLAGSKCYTVREHDPHDPKGIGDSYQVRQGSQRTVDSLLGKRIEVIFHHTLPEGVFGEAIMWCSGTVMDLVIWTRDRTSLSPRGSQ